MYHREKQNQEIWSSFRERITHLVQAMWVSMSVTIWWSIAGIRSITQISAHPTGSNISCALEDCHKWVIEGRWKIKKYLDEIAKTEKKIADLQQYLRGVQAALKQEEDNEMIRCIRGMKMDNDQLYDLLDGIQNGTVKFQVSRESNDEGSGSFVFTEENKEEYQNGEMEENE